MQGFIESIRLLYGIIQSVKSLFAFIEANKNEQWFVESSKLMTKIRSAKTEDEYKEIAKNLRDLWGGAG